MFWNSPMGLLEADTHLRVSSKEPSVWMRFPKDPGSQGESTEEN